MFHLEQGATAYQLPGFASPVLGQYQRGDEVALIDRGQYSADGLFEWVHVGLDVTEDAYLALPSGNWAAAADPCAGSLHQLLTKVAAFQSYPYPGITVGTGMGSVNFSYLVLSTGEMRQEIHDDVTLTTLRLVAVDIDPSNGMPRVRPFWKMIRYEDASGHVWNYIDPVYRPDCGINPDTCTLYQEFYARFPEANYWSAAEVPARYGAPMVVNIGDADNAGGILQPRPAQYLLERNYTDAPRFLPEIAASKNFFLAYERANGGLINQFLAHQPMPDTWTETLLTAHPVQLLSPELLSKVGLDEATYPTLSRCLALAGQTTP